jgi:hypothetical protein
LLDWSRQMLERLVHVRGSAVTLTGHADGQKRDCPANEKRMFHLAGVVVVGWPVGL